MIRKKLMSTVVIALLLILLSSCGNKNNSTVNTQSENVQNTNETIVPTSTRTPRYTQLSTNAIIKAGNNYLFVKQDKQEFFDYYDDSTFRIEFDLSIEYKKVASKRLDKLWSDSNLPLICSGSFYVERNSEITFDNYNGKEELLNEFKHLIWSRYFGDAEEKPIFQESTKAVKVDLLDFDEKTTRFELLVYTEDENIYKVDLEYVDGDKRYEFFEQLELCFSVNDVLNYDAESCTNALLAHFMNIYNFFQEHTICTIDAESEY